MKNNLFVLLFLFIFFLFFTPFAHASQIFQENLIGNPDQNWLPTFFTLHNSNNAIYDASGIIGTVAGDSFYTFQTTNLDSVIKWSVILNGNYGGIISCRDSNDVGSEERVIFGLDGTAQFNWYYNGGGSAGSKVNIGTVGLHDFELDCSSNIMTLKEDGSIILSTSTNWDNTQPMQMIRLDLFDTTTTITSYQYCDSNGCSNAPTPTSIPTPTLTTTPTPSPTPASGIHLNVPIVKQTSSPWQSLEYDSAHVWAPVDKTIHDWGCALTSAVMVLQYNGIVKMPDNSTFNPASLNTWLKSQSDGYIGNGLVNWIAIARLTKIIKLAFNNPNFTVDALEYKRPTTASTSQFVTDLTNNIPDILEEPGHFVVGTGIQGNTFTINDPFFSRNTLNDGYNNTFLSLGRYVPSHTDLSYILITGDPSLTFTLRNSANQVIGSTYIQQPLINDTNNTSSGSPLKIFYVEQPANGQYTLTVTTSGQNQQFSFNEYLYDKSGNVTRASVSGNTNSNRQFITTLVSKKVTFQTLLTDLQNAFQLSLLQQGTYIALKSHIEDVQKEVEKGKTTVGKIHLAVISLLINVLPGIKTGVKSLLQSDITTLLQSL